MPVDVLLVNADEPACRALAEALAAADIDVHVVLTAEDALYEHTRRDVDVVVAATELAGMDGIELCRVLKEQSQVGVIVLDRTGATPVALAAFDAGADDFVANPQAAELAARVRALVRRRRGSLRPRRRVRVGELVAVWTPAGRLRALDERFTLTPVQATILELLVERPGCVVPIEMLRDRVLERHGRRSADELDQAVRGLGEVLAQAGAAWALQHVPEGGWLLAA